MVATALSLTGSTTTGTLLASLFVVGLMMGDNDNRMRGFWRLTVGVIWFIIATFLIWLIWFPIAAVLAVIDMFLWQLLLGRESFLSDRALTTPYGYWVQNTEYVVLGQGEFNPLPYV